MKKFLLFAVLSFFTYQTNAAGYLTNKTNQPISFKVEAITNPERWPISEATLRVGEDYRFNEGTHPVPGTLKYGNINIKPVYEITYIGPNWSFYRKEETEIDAFSKQLEKNALFELVLANGGIDLLLKSDDREGNVGTVLMPI